MTPRHLTISLVVLAATAAPLAACGGSSGGSSGSSSSSGSSGASSSSGSSSSGNSGNSGSNAAKSGSSGGAQSSGGKTGAVSIANFKFAPASLTVKQGTKITVSNKDSTAHTATADDGKSFNTNDINPGSSATISLSKPGTYKYHCSIHPFMHGTIIVK